MVEKAIYLDHNATTPVADEVLKKMLPFLGRSFGNPSSSHPLGEEARRAVEEARARVARLIGAEPEEIYFTACATESNNLALWGPVLQRGGRGHVVVSRVEHPAILNPALFLEERGTGVSFAGVDERGVVSPDEVAGLIREDTILVSVMHANNETGVIQPVEEISPLAKGRGVLMHTDAAQSVGKIPVNVDALGVDMLSIAGHKMYAPKGVGALYVRRGVELAPLMRGGGQERGLRPGTENVAHIVGLGAAAALAGKALEAEMERQARLRDLLAEILRGGFPGLVIHGEGAARLPNTLSCAFPGIPGQHVLDGAPGVMASTGAACHEESVTLSHVLSAMGVSQHAGMGTVRLTLGRSTTEEDVRDAARMLLTSAKGLIS